MTAGWRPLHQALRGEVPAVASTDAAWLESQRRREVSLVDIVVGRVDAVAV